jgi:fructose-specific component phosphotransferase system IIB-like protein
VLRNPFPDTAPDWPYNYHGYATQDFLTIDGRFASDGTAATAAEELTELIEAAHARGLFIVLDIVINHSAEVFKYIYQGQVTDAFTDPRSFSTARSATSPRSCGSTAAVTAQPGWQNTLPAAGLTGDDAVWPLDLQIKLRLLPPPRELYTRRTPARRLSPR